MKFFGVGYISYSRFRRKIISCYLYTKHYLGSQLQNSTCEVPEINNNSNITMHLDWFSQNIRKLDSINNFYTYQIFLRILRKDRSCPFLQCVTILNTRYKSSMESYSHIGIKTMNQDHFVLLSRRKTSRIRKIKQINQVNRARCTTAIPRVSW